MLRQGPLSLTLHSLIEPLLAVLLIASPFLFGFSNEGAPTAVLIVGGVFWLLLDMSTRWKVSLVDSVPIAVHLPLDLALGVVLIAAPFLFSYSDEGGATAVSIVLGVVALLFALGTRWTGSSGPSRRDAGRHRARRRARVPS